MRIGPTISPIFVSGLKIALSNSGTIRPGGKLPREPPWLDEGHVENSLAQSANVCSPDAIIFMITFASPSDPTKMCRAVAFTASGGGPYSSFEKAFDIESKIPMPNDDDDACLPIVGTPELIGIDVVEGRNADTYSDGNIEARRNVTK